MPTASAQDSPRLIGGRDPAGDGKIILEREPASLEPGPEADRKIATPKSNNRSGATPILTAGRKVKRARETRGSHKYNRQRDGPSKLGRNHRKGERSVTSVRGRSIRGRSGTNGQRGAVTLPKRLKGLALKSTPLTGHSGAAKKKKARAGEKSDISCAIIASRQREEAPSQSARPRTSNFTPAKESKKKGVLARKAKGGKAGGSGRVRVRGRSTKHKG